MNIPKYQVIKNKIIESLKELPTNSSIPSERELVKVYEASRMTVRKAIDSLVNDGYLYRDSNKGTFVADKSLHKKNTSLDVLDDLENEQYKMIYFDVKESFPRDVQEHLNLRSDDSVVRVVRLLLLKGVPQAVEEIYINRFILSDEELSNIHNWSKFNKFISQGSLTQRFVPTLVPMKYAHLLNLKINDPIILVENFINNKNGSPLIYMKSYNNPNAKIIEITS